MAVTAVVITSPQVPCLTRWASFGPTPVPGMSPLEHGGKVADGDPHVAHRGIDQAVAEQILHVPDVAHPAGGMGSAAVRRTWGETASGTPAALALARTT